MYDRKTAYIQVNITYNMIYGPMIIIYHLRFCLQRGAILMITRTHTHTNTRTHTFMCIDIICF